MSNLVERLRLKAGTHVSLVNTMAEAAAEIEQLQELLRGIGANRYWEGRWRDEKADNERLRAAIAWTREVRPGKNPESGGAIVYMTWDQFNTMRALARAALEPKP